MCCPLTSPYPPPLAPTLIRHAHTFTRMRAHTQTQGIIAAVIVVLVVVAVVIKKKQASSSSPPVGARGGQAAFDNPM
jgi:hypothetical protein